MAIDTNIKEKLVLRQVGGALAIQPKPVLQRYGNLELHYSESVDPAAPPVLPTLDPAQLSLSERFAFRAFQLRHSDPYKAAKLARPRDKEPWDMEGCIVPPPILSRMPGAGAPAPITMPTSGWLEGSVAVGTIVSLR